MLIDALFAISLATMHKLAQRQDVAAFAMVEITMQEIAL